jgi:hypothetical protein
MRSGASPIRKTGFFSKKPITGESLSGTDILPLTCPPRTSPQQNLDFVRIWILKGRKAMGRQRPTAEQIISKLRIVEVETAKGQSIGQVCRKLEKTLQPGAVAQLIRLLRTRGDDANPFFKFRYAQFKKRACLSN